MTGQSRRILGSRSSGHSSAAGAAPPAVRAFASTSVEALPAARSPVPVRRPVAAPRDAVRRAGIAALTTLVTAAAACARDRPAGAATDTAAGEAVSADAAVAAAPNGPAVPLSHFAVPLDYDVTPVLAVVERAVPRTFGSLDSVRQVGTDARKHVAFAAAREPFVVTIDGPEVRLRTTLAYAARGYYRTPVGATLGAGCGAGDDRARRPRVVVELVTPLRLGPNWHLRSKARLARLEPASADDRCVLKHLRFDVTDRVIAGARQALTARLPDIDRQVARVDLTPQANGWWRSLNRPIRLTDGVWLLLGPTTLREGRVGGRGHLLAVDAGLDARPRIVTGAEPQEATPPLPPLARAGATPGFAVALTGVVDYATASRAVTAAVRGRSVTQAGHTVTVQGVTVTPAGKGRLALTAAFTGDANGTLRFVGTPRLDAAGAQVTVPDLDYDLATDSRLIAAAAWLGSDALRTFFRERARVPLAPALDRGRDLLVRGLNRTIGNALTLSATVDTVALQDVAVTAPGLVAHARATGRARASVRQHQ